MIATTFKNNAQNRYARRSLQTTSHQSYQISASEGTREDFGWLIDEIPGLANGDIVLITDSDITAGMDPSSLGEADLDTKIQDFIDSNPALFDAFTNRSLTYFKHNAKFVAQYGADGAQGFELDSVEDSSQILFIQSPHNRDFAELTQQVMGCTIPNPAYDDAAMAIMHECAHLLKKHKHNDRVEGIQAEAEAEGLMIASFQEYAHSGNLELQSLHPRLAFRSLQSILLNTHRDIAHINDPLGPDEGMTHGMSAGLYLTDRPLSDQQATALLKAPLQINTLVHWLSDADTQQRQEDKDKHYFSALAALHEEKHFSKNTLGELYTRQALEACRTYAGQWLDRDLIADYKAKMANTSPPDVQWDKISDLFEPRRGTYVAPSANTPETAPSGLNKAR